ncbi:MAG: hypothetical protein AB2A00_37610 [Myxococcota bacterium]
MRPAPALLRGLFVGALLMTLTLPAAAKPWKGMTPGKSTKAEVAKKFGKPTRELPNQGDCVTLASYQGDEAIAGARQSQFCFDANGKLLKIVVFPDTSLDRETVSEAFGDEYRKRLTDDFVVYWHYEKDGLVVFFDKEGKLVSAVQYIEPRAASGKKGGASGPADGE